MVSFATEAPFFNQLGMETLVLGPGDIAQAHQPDEYLALDRIRPTIDLLRSLTRRFCVGGEGVGKVASSHADERREDRGEERE